ncbi:MAG: tRNA pseudouridine(38-40) synthase TruA [Candidatus Accumulibacter sp.]|jgi:tRNA pseudouridine38-40 synthase|nr:tRNA pseudouridine(38-40) synthase TruA [Accumulibacter sp.]
MRIALGLEYDGSAFRGWQSQPGGDTVQDVLQMALGRIANETVKVVCAGRTDAGVHATGQVVHFDTALACPLTAWVRGVNTFLPPQVAVCWAHCVPDGFHARFSARARAYRYFLLNRPQRPGLENGRVGWHHCCLDTDKMRAAARYLLGEHDFSAFRAAGCQAKTPVKSMYRADVRRDGDLLVFDFEASAFLHRMVRNLVGALVYVGLEKRPEDWIARLLDMRDRRLAAPTFSAGGLYLTGINYEERWGLPDDDARQSFPGLRKFMSGVITEKYR